MRRHDGKSIAGRIGMSEHDAVLRANHTSVPCLSDCTFTAKAVVVDDQENIWARASDNDTSSRRTGEPPTNLLLVKPYFFEKFRGYAEVNEILEDDIPESSSLTETQPFMSDNEEPKNVDDNLFWVLEFLRKLHHRYYLHGQSLTVPQIVDQMQAEVLGGCTIVLSGLVPVNQQSRGDDKARARLPVVRYVEDLGATIVPDVTKKVTHVIAAQVRTQNAFKGSRVQGCAIINVAWLMSCYWSVSKQNVDPYLLVPIRLEESDLIERRPDRPERKAGVSVTCDDDDEPNTGDEGLSAAPEKMRPEVYGLNKRSRLCQF